MTDETVSKLGSPIPEDNAELESAPETNLSAAVHSGETEFPPGETKPMANPKLSIGS